VILERALITVKPGQAEAFKTAFPKARLHIAAAKGFHKCEMRQGIENPEDFLLLVWWETLEDHMVGFRESQAFQEWRAILGPLFAAPPQVVHHHEPL
jgi:heme-degrading monooxygenase HmoA